MGYYADHREAECVKQKARRDAAKAADPIAFAQFERDRYKRRRHKSPASYLLSSVKRRAAERGLPFDLTLEDLKIPDACPVLGIKLTPLTDGRCDTAPEVDRVVPERGYVRGNVAVISHRANRIKDNGTAAEHQRIAEWMRKVDQGT